VADVLAAAGALFADRDRPEPSLALFLNAGDPSFEVLERIVIALDEADVDCLELAVPFPNSPTDGPTIRRSARRALEAGTDLASTLAFVARVRPRLSHLKLVLLADWAHSVRGLALDDFLHRVKRAGCDGLLLHGVPPRVRPGYYASAHAAAVPIVTTCYAGSSAATLADAGDNATAYVYLVSQFGTGEGSGPPEPARLAPVIEALRECTAVPIATGFGIKTPADVRAVIEAGSDAAIVGSACVASVERALTAGGDPAAELRRFAAALRAG
jgi:tryptophan synthase alpha chain